MTAKKTTKPAEQKVPPQLKTFDVAARAADLNNELFKAYAGIQQLEEEKNPDKLVILIDSSLFVVDEAIARKILIEGLRKHAGELQRTIQSLGFVPNTPT